MPQTSDLVNDIKTVLDISSRVDERVKLIQVNQQEINTRLNQFISEFNQLSSRVSVLESKNGGRVHAIEEELTVLRTRFERLDAGNSMVSQTIEDGKNHREELEDKLDEIFERVQKVEHNTEGWQAKAKQYGGLIIQGIWVIVVCYVLYRLGINTAPIP